MGSEMCIRDSSWLQPRQRLLERGAGDAGGDLHDTLVGRRGVGEPVSYTHLTLPTNYSVSNSVVAVSFQKKHDHNIRPAIEPSICRPYQHTHVNQKHVHTVADTSTH